MHQIEPYSLHAGHIGDLRVLADVLDQGITAFVDLSAAERPPQLPRDVVSCHFPLIDGTGNPPWLVRLAVDVVVSLLRAETPTLLYCSAGMSRSLVIAAAAISIVSRKPMAACLSHVTEKHASDVSPGLWLEVCMMFEQVT